MKIFIVIVIILFMLSCTSMPDEMRVESEVNKAAFDNVMLFTGINCFIITAVVVHHIADNYKDISWY